MTIDFILNGEDVSVQAEPMERLVDLLRERFKLHSVIGDCGVGLCGKCLVLLEGKPVNACIVPAFRIRGAEVVSYEGFCNTEEHDKARRALEKAGLDLCAFCRGAYGMALGYLIEHGAQFEDEEVAELLSSIHCSCSAPSALLEAARYALAEKEGGRYARGR
jgi:aerobic carbon-monoxide dehydrogenase small subunit